MAFLCPIGLPLLVGWIHEPARLGRLSRDCSGCGNPDPHPRFFSSAYRHAFCGECADNTNACPSCNEPTSLNQGLHQSRACSGCTKADPHPRFFSSACGHAVCSECSTEADACPTCNETTSFVRIFDDEPYVCPICDLVTPGLGVFANCGHMTCGICAIRFAAQADDLGLSSPRCPFCQAQSHCCPIQAEFVPCSMTKQVDGAVDIENIFNANQGLRKSRACSGCGNPDPCPRFFSSACGHTVCRECADYANACPACNEDTSFVLIFEDENQPYVCAICALDTELGVFHNCGHVACGIEFHWKP
ncbi:hypothetical protein PRIPAC_78578 [Pristionchus pacificus]|uniref:RING finger protein 10 n=1 Tax=Pristionchus pacificus TaxID=54126 RepID=A0A2A6BH66_PRIPA|nr:hypothetical protein PRIPAC_78578 [Pristionchus pacificus]|eukprot:PDM65176.1 hypothetical protein PRIPAC_52118 [Pristionchus pacificus]